MGKQFKMAATTWANISNGGHHMGKQLKMAATPRANISKWRPPRGQTFQNSGHHVGKHFKMAANTWENISKWQTFQNDIYLRSKHLNMEDHCMGNLFKKIALKCLKAFQTDGHKLGKNFKMATGSARCFV